MRLTKALNLLETDRELTIYLAVIHIIVAFGHGLFDIAATALLIGQLGPDTLPQVYLGSSVLLIFLGLFIIPLVDRLDRSALFAGVLVFFALLLFVSTPLAAGAPELVYRGLYIACYVMKTLVFLQFWLLAGDLLDLRQARRVFPVLLGCSLLGGLTASGVATFLPRWLPTERLLTLAGTALLLGLLPLSALWRRYRAGFRAHERPQRFSTIWEDFTADVRGAWSSPLLRSLSVCLLLLALLSQVLDFLLGKAAHVQFTDPLGIVRVESLATFYAVLNGVVIGAGALVQLLLANRFISSLGVIRGLLAAPLTLLAGFGATGIVWLASGGLLAAGFFAATVAARGVQKVLRISLVRTSTDLIFNAIPPERRGRGKAFKETLIEPLGVLLSGLFLLAGTRVPLQFVLGGSVLLSVLFLVSAIHLKESYLQSLLNILKEKSRFRPAFPSTVMRQVKVEPQQLPAASSLIRALDNDAASVRLLAFEVAAELREPEIAPLLVERFQEEEDSEVRAGMLRALGNLVHNQVDSRADELSDRDPRVRASGLLSMAETGIFRPEDRNADESSTPPVSTPPAMEERDPRGVFAEIVRSDEPWARERLVHYLEDGDGTTRHLAARALEKAGEPAIGMLTVALWSTDVEGRRYVIRALTQIGSEAALSALLPVLSLEAEEAYYDLLRIDALDSLPGSPAITLLKDSLRQRVDRAKRNSHQILRAVFLGAPGMRLILSNLNHPDRFVRSSAIEALEVRVDPALLRGILPLFEHDSANAIAEHGRTLFPLPERPPVETLLELTRHRSSWIRACAIYAVGLLGEREHVREVESRLGDPYELARLNAVEAIGHLGDENDIPLLERLRKTDDERMRDYASTAIATLTARV